MERGVIWELTSGVESERGFPLRVKKKKEERDWVKDLGRRESLRWWRVWDGLGVRVRVRVWVLLGFLGSGDWMKIWRFIFLGN